MAKIKIAELDIDASAIIKNLEKTKKEIDQLVQAQKELKKSGNTSSHTFIENEAKLKGLRKEYNSGIKVVQEMTGGVEKLETELNKEIKTIRAAKDQNQALRRIRDEINVNTEEGQILLEKLNDRIDQNTELAKDNTDAISKQKSNVGNYTDSINKSKAGVKGFGGAVEASGRAVKGFGVALKAAGIGLAIAAFAALSNAMGKNEKVMKIVNTVTGTFAGIVQPLISSLVDGAAAAYNATGGFDAMGKVVSSLITMALTPLKTAFYGIKAVLLGAQLAWEKSWLGSGDKGKIAALRKNLDSTKDSLKEIAVESVKASKTLYTSMGEAIAETAQIGKSIGSSVAKAVSSMNIKEIVKNSFGTANMEAELKKLDAAQERIMLNAQIRAEKHRQIRDNQSLSDAARADANKKLQAVMQQQIKDEQAVINKKITLYQKALEINAADMDAQQGLIEAQNALIEVQERVTGMASEALTARNEFRSQETENVEANNQEQIEIAQKKSDAEIQIEKEKQERITELKNKFKTKEREREILDTQTKIDKHYADLEAEIQLMIEEDAIKKEMIRNLKSQWQEETAVYQAQKKEQEALKLQQEIEQYAMVQQKKIDAKRKAVDAIAGLFGQETAVAKAALIAKQVLAMKEWAIDNALLKSKQTSAIAEATMDTSKGVAKTASSVPFPWNIPLIIGFIAQTAGIISSIKGAFSSKGAPKFEKGGLMEIGGQRHSLGGTKFFGEDGTTFEAERGELIGVVNRNAAAVVQGLNNSYPMTSKATGSNYFAAGGFVARGMATTSTAQQNVIDYDLLAAKMAQAYSAVPAPQVAVTEINDMQFRYAQVIDRANF